MKACFPVAHDRGLDSVVHPHFGSAPFFLVVDSETRTSRAIPNPERERAHGMCNPVEALAGEGIDAVVVSGIGPGALDRLQTARIAAYQTPRATVGEALEAIARGALPPVLAGCESHGTGRGHGCGGGHGHRHQHRHGRT